MLYHIRALDSRWLFTLWLDCWDHIGYFQDVVYKLENFILRIFGSLLSVNHQKFTTDSTYLAQSPDLDEKAGKVESYMYFWSRWSAKRAKTEQIPGNLNAPIG